MATKRIRECHYDVLGVDMESDIETIRKSYKKAALQWHPDKNMHQIELATEKFRFVSEAYQVLSDPKERSWYNTHRESILRGGDGTHTQGDDSGEDYVPDLWKYFSCPSTPQAFVDQFTRAFEEILSAETLDSERQEDVQQQQQQSLPSFGTVDTNFEDVKRFYVMWECFSSKMTFSWKDKYDTREAGNRFQRRHVEKLNESERSVHRKEYSNLVRSLVQYCKKRDARFAKGMQEQEERNREKLEKQAKWESERKANKALQREQRRTVVEENREQEEEAQEEEEEEVPVVVMMVWNCGVCGKEFKSEKQLDNHESSKKHKDAVKLFLKKGGVLPQRGGGMDPKEEEDLELLVEEVVAEFDSVTLQESFQEKDETREKDAAVMIHEEEEEEIESRQEDDNVHNEEEDDEKASPAKKNSIGKAKLKKLAKLRKNPSTNAAAAEPSSFSTTCATCLEDFPSRTKLFQHMKERNHETVISSSNSKSEKKKKKM